MNKGEYSLMLDIYGLEPQAVQNNAGSGPFFFPSEYDLTLEVATNYLQGQPLVIQTEGAGLEDRMSKR